MSFLRTMSRRFAGMDWPGSHSEYLRSLWSLRGVANWFARNCD
jgi:hypothetical protein